MRLASFFFDSNFEKNWELIDHKVEGSCTYSSTLQYSKYSSDTFKSTILGIYQNWSLTKTFEKKFNLMVQKVEVTAINLGRI